MSRIRLVFVLLLGVLAGGTVFAQGAGRQFDHVTTGYELTGSHRVQSCESCHVDAVFNGTPRACFSCHSPGSRVGATPKPAGHILSGEQCGACHSTATWSPATRFDHEQALGNCASCHNGAQAPGKSPGHVQTAMDCNACHGSRAWSPAKFDHSGITAVCATCHESDSQMDLTGNGAASCCCCRQGRGSLRPRPAVWPTRIQLAAR